MLLFVSPVRQTSPDSPHQQLTMTGVAGEEEMEDGLAAQHRPPPKHLTSLACIARVA